MKTLSILFVLFAAAVPLAAGPVIVYSDRSAWQAAAGTTVNIDFEGLAAPGDYAYYPAGLTIGNVTFTAPPVDAEGQPSDLFVIDAGYSPDYDWNSGAILSAQNGSNRILATTASPTFAFGVDLMSTGVEGSDFLVTLSTGESFTVNTSGNPQRTFFGVVADDTPILWALFAPQSQGADGDLDNFEFADAAPEPGTAILALAFFVGLAAVKKRKGWSEVHPFQ